MGTGAKVRSGALRPFFYSTRHQQGGDDPADQAEHASSYKGATHPNQRSGRASTCHQMSCRGGSCHSAAE